MLALFPKLNAIITFVLTLNCFLQLNAQSDTSIVKSQSSTQINSSSGNYISTRYKPQFVASLPESISETSGLIFINGELWTINDSGNQPEIYQVDSINGNVLRTVVVRSSVNTDWESITQDDSNLYIGDFGNNAGSRTDLRILKIAKTDFLNQVNDTVLASYIQFLYPDQTHFDAALNNHNFDCEAFFFDNDSLHLFSKNWSDLQTNHYVLPVDPGNYKARLAESYNVDGLITDATINIQGNIVLLGYKNNGSRSYSCFAWLLSRNEGQFYFNGSKTRLELGSALHLGQTEGVIIKDDNTGWLSSESVQAGRIHRPAKLFSFNFGSYFK
jgi:hypothetical protein